MNSDERPDLEAVIESYKYHTTHPYFNKGAVERLKKEYDMHKTLVVGFDFDNTIFDVHNRGGNYSEVIKLLQQCKKFGFTLCLYTAELREEWLKWKVDYCKHFKITPDYVNESPLLPGTKKPFFNILLDDRAGLESAFVTLKEVVEYAEKHSRGIGKGE